MILTDNVRQALVDLYQNGFAVVPLPRPEAVVRVRDLLECELQRFLGRPEVSLERYHHYVESDEEHATTLEHIVWFAREHWLARKMFEEQLEFFVPLLGPDIGMTVTTNFRIVRPHRRQDNLGFHRDVDVGHSAYELNCFIPFLDLDETNTLKVLPASDKLSYTDLPFHKVTNPMVTRGDRKNRIGFMYDQLEYEVPFRDRLASPRIGLGQALLFSANVLHGQEVNESAVTRWTTDFEVANVFMPLSWTHHGDEDKYQVITESYLAKIGRKFHGAEFPRESQLRDTKQLT